MAAYKERIERLDMLERLIPAHLPDADCPDPGRLLAGMAGQYGDGSSAAARRRAIQRDLENLVDAGRIAVVNPRGKPLRYRRCTDEAGADPRMWAYARDLMYALIRDALPERRLERLWTRLREEGDEFGLGEDKLRIIGDTQRLVPADIREDVLGAVLEALGQGWTLQVRYRDAQEVVTEPLLHPQALLQRGPRVYLYALKNDEMQPVRMYALHRIIHARLGDAPARVAPGFKLDVAVRNGQADFAGGEEVTLALRVRGYVADLLRDCPLCEGQTITDEPDDSPFVARVHATVPATGQLLRWLLGCGDNLEVLAPPRLREVVAGQAGKVAALYAGGQG